MHTHTYSMHTTHILFMCVQIPYHMSFKIKFTWTKLMHNETNWVGLVGVCFRVYNIFFPQLAQVNVFFFRG